MFKISKEHQLKSLSSLFYPEKSPADEDTSSPKSAKSIKGLNDNIHALEEETGSLQNDDSDASLDEEVTNSEAISNARGNHSGKSRKEKAAEQKEINSRTVFVGNVPIAALENQKQFKKLFYGVQSLRFRSIAFTSHRPRKIQFLKKEFHEKRDSVNAYVVFRTFEYAEKALELNGVQFMGKHLRVNSLEKHFSSANSLFIGNLPFDVSEESLYELFGDAGEINSVRVIRDRKTNVGKGFAYVEFKEKESVSLGLKLNGSEINSRKIRVSKSKDNLAQGKKLEGHRATKDDAAKLSTKLKRKVNTTKVQKKGKAQRKK